MKVGVKMNIDEFVLESAVYDSDTDALMEFFGFGKKKFEHRQGYGTGHDDGYNSNDTVHNESKERWITIEEAQKIYASASQEAISKFKRTQNYIKTAAIKGNAWVNQKVDSIIDAKKHEMLNKIMKGVVKATIVAALLAALTAAIVIPGGGIAAAAVANKALGGVGTAGAGTAAAASL
jgi:hypothetical protein